MLYPAGMLHLQDIQLGREADFLWQGEVKDAESHGDFDHVVPWDHLADYCAAVVEDLQKIDGAF